MVQNIYQNGKIFKDIEFQILLRKIDIKNLEKSIDKAFKLAGVDGPKGNDNMGVDYSRVISTTPAAHIGLDDVIRLTSRDSKQIQKLQKEISDLKRKKKSLIKMIKSLDGIEEKIFYQRVIMKETQESAAEKIGVSTRHLQRIEKSLKNTLKIYEM